jgi:hypothetical protein
LTKGKFAVNKNRSLHPKTLARLPNCMALRPMIGSFLKSALHLLSEARKEAKLIRFVLRVLSWYVLYLAAYPRLARSTLLACAWLWLAPPTHPRATTLCGCRHSCTFDSLLSSNHTHSSRAASSTPPLGTHASQSLAQR